nr:MAG TPA: hypothetical protein [Caudoviricetes sp.]
MRWNLCGYGFCCCCGLCLMIDFLGKRYFLRPNRCGGEAPEIPLLTSAPRGLTSHAVTDT